MGGCSCPAENVWSAVRRRVSWSDIDIRRLVCLYRRQPCLWKRDDPFYLDIDRRRRAYNEIHRDANTLSCPAGTAATTFVEIMMKLREVRKSYVAELKKVLESESNCCRYEPKAEWFYELHDFLYPNLDYDETIELHCIADRSAAEECPASRWEKTVEGSYSERSVDDKASSRSRGCSTTLQKLQSTRSSTKKGSRSTVESHPGSQTRSTRVTYRAPAGFDFCSSRESMTDLPTSSDDSLVRSRGPSSSTIVGDNRMTYIDRSFPQTCACEDAYTKEIGERDCSPECRRSGCTKTIDRYEIFAMRVAQRLRQMEPISAFRVQTAIQKVLTDRAVCPNANANASQRNAVNRPGSLSRTFVNRRISIPRHREATGPMGEARVIRKNHTPNRRSMSGDEGGKAFSSECAVRSVRSRDKIQDRQISRLKRSRGR